MKRLLICTILLPLLCTPAAMSARRPYVVRVCVFGVDNSYAHYLSGRVNLGPEVEQERDLVVKYLNEVKSPENKSVKVEAMALNYTNPAMILREAAQEDCIYCVSVTLNVYFREEFSAAGQPQLPPPYGLPDGPAPCALPETTAPKPLPVRLSIFILQRGESGRVWVSPPNGSYSQNKQSAKQVADELYKVITRRPGR